MLGMAALCFAGGPGAVRPALAQSERSVVQPQEPGRRAAPPIKSHAKSPTKSHTKAGHAAVPHAHDQAHDDDAGSTPESRARRQELLAQGEAALVRGDVGAAAQAFDQAALMSHAADIELGVLRTQMQAGEYRRALAFAAHTAGVHLDHVEGRVFYAWILNLGAQTAVAEQTLQQAEAVAPTQALVAAVRQRFQSGEMSPGADLLGVPVRLAPYATGATVSAQARVVASATLLSDGVHALAPLSALPGMHAANGSAIWLRNGLGHTVEAELEKSDLALGLALLKLKQPLPTPGGELVPPRDAFPGSAAYALHTPPNAAGLPAWPLMRAGFLGMPERGAPEGLRRLGIELPGQGARGGPVFDAGGRLVGIALGGATDHLVTIGALRGRFGERFGSVSPDARPNPVATDELYERGMKATLQVLVAPGVHQP